MNSEYIGKLESVIKQMLTPLKGIPFSLVIETLSGNKVIPFSNSNPDDIILLDDLIKIANLSGQLINRKGIEKKRANEVGNEIESYVLLALKHSGFTADIPRTSSGKMKSVGYPDIYFIDNSGRINYLECKTFNDTNINTTLRSFYLSPSEDFKITKNAHHFVISYEIIEIRRNKDTNLYNCKSWKLLSLDNLDVDVKYEFNSNNQKLYSKELILAEGPIR